MFTGEARIPLLSAVAIDDGPVPNLPGFEEPGRDQLVNLRAANAIQAAKLGD